VETHDSGLNALAVVKRFTPDLLLLYVMLPHGPDGFEICRALNDGPGRTPVIILSARGHKEDRIRGLTLGADDYVTKPFALDELLARVHAVLRRTKPPIDQLTLGNTVISGGFAPTAGPSRWNSPTASSRSSGSSPNARATSSRATNCCILSGGTRTRR